MRSSLRGVKNGCATSQPVVASVFRKDFSDRLCLGQFQHTGFVLITTASGLQFRCDFSHLRSAQCVDELKHFRSREHAGKYELPSQRVSNVSRNAAISRSGHDSQSVRTRPK